MRSAKLRARSIRIDRRNIPAQLLLYLLVGGLSLCADFIVFLTLLPVGLVPAVIAGFVVGTVANYILSTVLAFASGRFGRVDELFRLFCVALIGSGLTLGIVLALSALGLSAVLAKIVATVAVFGWNFLGRRYFVFHAELPERSWSLANRSLAKLDAHKGDP
jgi:putative flippase GtrA